MPDVRTIPLGGVDWSGQPLPAEAQYYTPSMADVFAGYYGGEYPAQAESGVSPASVLAAFNRVGTGAANLDYAVTHGPFETIKRFMTSDYAPGLRREDVTDIPPPQGPTEDSNIFGRALGLAPQRYEPNDPAIGAAGEAALTVAGAGNLLNAERGTLGMFVGDLAKGQNPELYERARKLAAAGATNEEIYRATGLDQLQPGKFAAQVPDYGTTWTPAGLEGMQAGSTMKLGEAYAHPQLFGPQGAYPQLADWKVQFRAPPGMDPTFRWEGATDLANKIIYLNPQEIQTPADMRRVVLHELQHPIQAFQGWPTGASTESRVVVQAAQKALADRLVPLQARAGEILDAAEAYAAEQTAAGRPEGKEALLKEYVKKNKLGRELADNAYAQYQIQHPNTLAQAKYDAYWKVAGEEQARNTEKLADVPPEQLRQQYPWATEDTPRGEQLIRYVDPNYQLSELPSFPEQMDRARQAAFERTQKLGATGNYGLPPGGYKTPDAPKGSFERLAAEQRAGFQQDKARILDQFREATGQEIRGRPAPLLAPGEEDLQFSVGRKGKDKIAAPNIRNPNAPLFDYRNMEQVPDVPQFDLPRNEPTRELAPDIAAALTPENIKRVNAIVRPGIKKGAGGLEWYYTVPLKEEFISELGRREGSKEFGRSIDAIAATSPDMKVPGNIRTGSYYNYLLRNEMPLPERLKKPETGNWYVPPGQIPNPYGSRAQALHVQNMEALRDTGVLPVLDNPKPPSFGENLKGNYRPVAVDRHNLTLLGVDRTAPGAGYAPLERMQQQQAEKLGVAPAQYQAGGWLPYGESGPDPFLKMFEERIAHTAEQRGQTKAQVLKDYIHGRAPLLSLTPALALLGQLFGQGPPASPQAP